MHISPSEDTAVDEFSLYVAAVDGTTVIQYYGCFLLIGIWWGTCKICAALGLLAGGHWDCQRYLGASDLIRKVWAAPVVHVPMSVSYGDEMQPGVSAVMGSLCLPQAQWALRTKGHFPTACACRAPWAGSSLPSGFLQLLSRQSQFRTSPHTAVRPCRNDLAGHSFLREKGESSVSCESGTGIGILQCWDFMTTNHKDSVDFVTWTSCVSVMLGVFTKCLICLVFGLLFIWASKASLKDSFGIQSWPWSRCWPAQEPGSLPCLHRMAGLFRNLGVATLKETFPLIASSDFPVIVCFCRTRMPYVWLKLRHSVLPPALPCGVQYCCIWSMAWDPWDPCLCGYWMWHRALGSMGSLIRVCAVCQGLLDPSVSGAHGGALGSLDPRIPSAGIPARVPKAL